MKFWLIHYYSCVGSEGLWLVFQICLILIDLQDVPQFDSWILSNTILSKFGLVFWWETFGLMIPAIFLMLLLGGLICFCTFKSSLLVFMQKFCFDFHQFNFKYGAYLVVGHSLVCDCPKNFLVFFCQILRLILVWKPPLSIHISASFSFCFCS